MSTIIDNLPFLLEGLQVTLVVSVLSFALAVVASFALGIGRGWGPRPIRALCAVVVEFFRGSSALVQLFWAFYVLPQIGITLPPLVIGVIVLGLNEAAYASEIVRGGMKSIPKGQYDAARVLGLSPLDTWRRVILPQAGPILVPPFGNIAVAQIKFTSLLSLIAVHDLTSRAGQLRFETGESVLIYGFVLIVYFLITLVTSYGFRLLERKVALPGMRQQGSRPPLIPTILSGRRGGDRK